MFHFISQWYLKDRLFSGTDCCCRSLYFILSSNDRSIKVCKNVVQITFIYWWNYKMNKKFTFFFISRNQNLQIHFTNPQHFTSYIVSPHTTAFAGVHRQSHRFFLTGYFWHIASTAYRPCNCSHFNSTCCHLNSCCRGQDFFGKFRNKSVNKISHFDHWV